MFMGFLLDAMIFVKMLYLKKCVLGGDIEL